MNIDLGLVLYVENAILTASAILAWIHRDGHTLMDFKGEEEDATAPAPVIFVVLGSLFWPIAWLVAAVGFVAILIRKLGQKAAA